MFVPHANDSCDRISDAESSRGSARAAAPVTLRRTHVAITGIDVLWRRTEEKVVMDPRESQEKFPLPPVNFDRRRAGGPSGDGSGAPSSSENNR